MTLKAKAGWTIGVTMGLCGAIIVTGWLLGARHFSDPEARRSPMLSGWDQVYWDEHTSPAPPPPPPAVGDPFSPVKRTASGNLVSLTFDDRTFVRREDRKLNYKTLEADPDTNVIKIPEGGEIELMAIAHVFDPMKGVPAKRARDGRDGIAAVYYHPKFLNSLSPEEMEAAGIPEDDFTFPDFYYREKQSLFRAVLKPRDTPEIDYQHIDVYDARTHWKVSGGGSVGTPVATSGLKLWHETPVVFTYQIASGPVVEVDIPTDQIGWQTVVNDQFRVQFLTHEPTWSSNRNWEKKGLAEITIKETKHLSTAYFLFDDPQFAEACLVRTVGYDGQFKDHALTASSSQLYSAHLRLPKDEIAKLQLRFFPNHYRLQYRIESLPNIPEFNRDITNLFRTRIPHILVDSHYQLTAAISWATHRTFKDSYLRTVEFKFPSGYFPKEFTNVTAQELLEEYDRYTVAPKPLAVPREENVIDRRTPPGFLEVLKDRLIALKDRIFP